MATKKTRPNDRKVGQTTTKNTTTVSSPKSLIGKIIVTEKTTAMADKNQYTFDVAKNATKNEIKKLIEKMYKVKPVSVNTLRVKPKAVFMKGHMGTLKGTKKAVVTLKKGDSLPLSK